MDYAHQLIHFLRSGFIALLCLWCGAVLANERTLNLLTWQDYISPDLISSFERHHNVRVRQIYFNSDEERTSLLVNSEGRGFDLIVVSGIEIKPYASRGWLAKLDYRKLRSYQHLETRWKIAFTDSEIYGFPYFWGTTGIVYREDLVARPISRWMELFQPEESLRGRIGMVEDSLDLIAMALKSLGHSLNSVTDSELDEAETLLLRQKPFVGSYEYSLLDEKAKLVTGELWASFIYSGDALMLQQYQPNLKYVLPKEGSNIWIDYMTVGNYASEPELAYQFLEFINSPQHAALNAQHVFYATPNEQAREFLPERFLNNPAIYPPNEVLDRSEFHTRLPINAVQRRNQIGHQVID